ncbi:MAG: hypothetical protein OEV42_14960, partial [Deltaproteobacteria bacterium]|nr:hypothetical protein [Deltaproteobacteria bacterium]
MTSGSKQWFPCLIAALIIGLLPVQAPGKRISEKDIPDTLKPWMGWVLHGYEEKRCPSQYNSVNTYRCLWPSRLELEVDNKGGIFSQKWQVLKEDWIYLPGDGKFWPQEVTAGGKAVSVIERGGRPAVYLEKGEHLLKGRFDWKEMPESLQTPPETALIDMKADGKEVHFPNLDIHGKLWLKGRDYAQKRDGKEEDRLDLKVYRRIVDEIPLTITTQIDMDVAGGHREVLLGKVTSGDYIPLHLSGILPVRLEADGRLRVQVRPGRWTVTLTVRGHGPVYDISFVKKGEPWVKEEIWVFESRPSLRLVEIEGGTPIDPQQTTLPDDWRPFPAYRMKEGEALKIIEKKRGDPEPPADQLELTRDLWLDFNGKGYTIKDAISGSMRRGWRLEMTSPVELGRVSIDGRDQFITRMEKNGPEGVEVRKGSIRLEADSRLERAMGEVPTGWKHDFQKVKGRLHLPAGWRIFHAGGVDHMPGTWLKGWNLLDLFIALIIALSFMKLWTKNWGLIALAALLLFYHEPGAPRWIWLHILAAVALLRVLPQGKAVTVMAVYRWLALLLLILISIPFMVNQVRQGIYPQLEKPWLSAGKGAFQAAAPAKPEKTLTVTAPEPEPMPEEALVMEEDLLQDKEAPDMDAFKSRGFSSTKQSRERFMKNKAYYAEERLDQYDPQATIQTGPGLPQWKWNTFSFSWNGPLERNQSLKVILIPPLVTGIFCFLRVALLAILVLKLLGVEYGGRGGSFSFGTRRSGKAAMAAFLLLGLLRGTAEAGNIPPEELLHELRTKLLEEPACAPRCADSQRLMLESRGENLTMRMSVESYADTYIPLPGQARQWLPARVHLNGRPAKGLFRSASGQLWLNVPGGRHQVLLAGPLPKRKSVQIQLPLNPHRVEAKVRGWTLEGLHDNGVTDGQIQMTRIDSEKKKSTGPETLLEPATLPPFVRIERTLRMGLTWQIVTRVIRESHSASAILLEVPLVEGESVTSEGVRVKEGHVLVNMGPGIQSAEWTSVLEISGKVVLKAADNSQWTEIWKLDLSPVWHADMTGIPAVHHQDSRGSWLPEWRPWPGESLTIAVTRPEGVEGRSLTVDRSLIEVSPGRTATDARLSLALRSSRGGQHDIKLPEGSNLLEVKINGRTQPIRQTGGRVSIPLLPGAQMVSLNWRMPEGMGTYFSTPVVDLG